MRARRQSNPQADEPSGRYQVLEGADTPTDECPSGPEAPGPVQDMVRSAYMGFPSLHVIRVENSLEPTFEEGLMVVWLLAGRVTVPPDTVLEVVM